MGGRTTITRADLLPWPDYAARRQELRRVNVERKRRRRLAIGPVATAFFENWHTIWMQIQEMLHVERGGEAQIEDELHAYASLVPNGRELVMTLMFEIDDPGRRRDLLGRLGGVEQTVSLRFGGETACARPESDLERTDDQGKASAVHFLHFDLNPVQIDAFRQPGQRVLLGLDHPAYGHFALLPEEMRAELAADLTGS